MHSPQNDESHENPEDSKRWLISYADYTTLLFAFFVVLYSTSEMNLIKVKELEQSLREQFTNLRGSGGGIAYNQEHSDSAVSPPIQTFDWKKHGGQKTLKNIEVYMESKLSPSEIQKKVQNIGKEELGIRISLAASSLFEPKSSELKPQALSMLNKIGQWIKEKKYKILVESHIDGQLSLSRSSYASHRDLTADRSTEVVRYLVQKHKISPFRLIGVSYGSSRPIVSEDSPFFRNKNNRTDFLILTEDSPF